MSLIKLEKINKIYSPGKKIAFQDLTDINLEIQKGEMVAITGPSGSGKSTLMNMIGLLDRPTSGEYLLDDKPISLNMSDRKLARLRNQKVGFVFQTFNLLPKFSVLENVILPTIYGRVSSRREKAIEILNKVGLGERIGYRPPELSGGEKQRVAIARALICEPEIILADEPTGNLDSQTGQEIIDLLKNLNTEGRTIIIVTHDEKIAAACSRRIKLLDGKVVADEKQNTLPPETAIMNQEEIIRPIPDDGGVHFVQLH